jgi:hypothetical protein
MAIQVQGNGGIVAEVDGANFRALRATMRPVDYGSLGAYSACHLSGTMAAGLAANSEIFQFRWTDATRFALITQVMLCGMAGSATAFAAGFAKIDCLVARGWTADGSGGTAMTLTGNNQKLRTPMGTTLVGAIRGSSTAALTAGTKTLDSQPIGLMTWSIGTAANVIYVGQVQLFDGASSHPIVLAQNEGIVCRATVPATGTWQFGLAVQWVEVTSY